MEKTDLGLRIKEVRVNKGFTQETLSEKAGIGVTYLSEIERGLKMPSLKTFIKIVETLDVSADYILRDEVTAGKSYVDDEIIEMLTPLSPQQRKAAVSILDAFIKTIK